MARSRDRLWLAGALVAALGEVILMRLSAGPGGIVHRRFGLFWNIAGAWALFAVAAICLYRVRRTKTVVLLALVFAVVLRLAAISPKAPLSDDLYRYAWDGTVQTHGVDPYRYAPLSPKLADLRTPWLFPADHPDATKINRPTERTIYPPAAEGWFTAMHVIVPVSWHDRGFELVGLLTELAVLAVLLALLRGDRRRSIVLYALCPLPVLEVVQNAHVDGLAVLLVVITIWALSRGRRGWAAVALAAATLVKLYPALLLPIVLRAGTWWERLRSLALFVALIVVAYVPHVLAVGPKVLGYLPGYLKEEQYGSGSRYLLVDLFGLHGATATTVAITIVAAVAVAVFYSRAPDASAATYLFVAALLLVTPVQPWYGLCLVALVAITGQWWLLAITAGAYLLFFGEILDSHPVGLGQLGYGLGAAVALSGGWLTLRRSGISPPQRGVRELAHAVLEPHLRGKP